jgi:hypothetical protein
VGARAGSQTSERNGSGLAILQASPRRNGDDRPSLERMGDLFGKSLILDLSAGPLPRKKLDEWIEPRICVDDRRCVAGVWAEGF